MASRGKGDLAPRFIPSVVIPAMLSAVSLVCLLTDMARLSSLVIAEPCARYCMNQSLFLDDPVFELRTQLVWLLAAGFVKQLWTCIERLLHVPFKFT